MSLRTSSKVIVIHRENLISVLRLCTKTIIDKSCFALIDDDSDDLNNLSNIIEHMFLFQLKVPLDTRNNIYSILSAAASRNTEFADLFAVINGLDKLKHFYSKFRALIRLCLMKKKLSDLLRHLTCKHISLLNRFYYEDGVWFGESATLVINHLMGLSAVDMSFDLRRCDETLFYPRSLPINYTPYLVLRYSAEGCLDDKMEARGVDVIEAEDNTCQHSSSTSCVWQERFMRVESQLKRATEQKSFLEEVNYRLKTDMESKAKELERYDATILELQTQLTLIHEQYTREKADVRTKGLHSQKLIPIVDGITRPRRPQLLREDSDPICCVEVNDSELEIEHQEFDGNTASFTSPSSHLENYVNGSLHSYSYTESISPCEEPPNDDISSATMPDVVATTTSSAAGDTD